MLPSRALRLLVPALALAAATPTAAHLAPATAAPGGDRVERRAYVNDDGEGADPRVDGGLAPTGPCAWNQRVVLYRLVEGTPRRVATSRTDGYAHFAFAGDDRPAGRYVVRAPRSVADGARCSAARVRFTRG